MFFKTKKGLEEAIKSQQLIISEKESELKAMQQRLYYAEGQVKVYQDMVDVLRVQLKEEMTRTTDLQKTFITNQAVSTDRFLENVNRMYEEDPDTISDIETRYPEEGEL